MSYIFIYIFNLCYNYFQTSSSLGFFSGGGGKLLPFGLLSELDLFTFGSPEIKLLKYFELLLLNYLKESSIFILQVF